MNLLKRILTLVALMYCAGLAHSEPNLSRTVGDNQTVRSYDFQGPSAWSAGAKCAAKKSSDSCWVTGSQGSPTIAQILFPNPNASGQSCSDCIKQWCDWECSGYGDECPACMKQYCDWEC
jgi:hypothetical protein